MTIWRMRNVCWICKATNTHSECVILIAFSLQLWLHACASVLGKGKSIPLQSWSGPEGSRKLRFPDFVTTAQEGGKVVSLTHRPHLPPGNPPGTHFC